MIYRRAASTPEVLQSGAKSGQQSVDFADRPKDAFLHYDNRILNARHGVVDDHLGAFYLDLRPGSGISQQLVYLGELLFADVQNVNAGGPNLLHMTFRPLHRAACDADDVLDFRPHRHQLISQVACHDKYAKQGDSLYQQGD